MNGICQTCGLPAELCMCNDIAKEQMVVEISVDTRKYRKAVTLIRGIDVDTDITARELKSYCATGGTVKHGVIELQGKHVKKVAEKLRQMGYTVKEVL